MLIACPSCRKVFVEVPEWSFSMTSVDVPVCDECRDSGLVSVTIKVSGLLAEV